MDWPIYRILRPFTYSLTHSSRLCGVSHPWAPRRHPIRPCVLLLRLLVILHLFDLSWLPGISPRRAPRRPRRVSLRADGCPRIAGIGNRSSGSFSSVDPALVAVPFSGSSFAMSRRRATDGDVRAEEDLKRMEMKHAGLKQDYYDLQRETRAMKKRLQRAKLKKDNLLAEVRFLRRRYKVLKKNSLEPTVMEDVSPCEPMMGAQAMVGLGLDSTTREASCEEHAVSRGILGEPSSSLDWSHGSEDKPLAAREFQVFWEPLRTTGQGEVSTFVDAAKRKSLLESSGLASELKLSIFKDIPNGFVLPARSAKRNISWQDQMALKV